MKQLGQVPLGEGNDVQLLGAHIWVLKVRPHGALQAVDVIREILGRLGVHGDVEDQPVQGLASCIELKVIQLQIRKDPPHQQNELLMDLLLIWMLLQVNAQLLSNLLG